MLPGLWIRSFTLLLFRSFYWATERELLSLLLTKEQPWAICSVRKSNMSDFEQITLKNQQFAYKKKLNVLYVFDILSLFSPF